MKTPIRLSLGLLACSGAAMPASAAPYAFDNGLVDGRMAVASRPSGGGAFEIEAADDFLLTDRTRISSAGFVGLLPVGTTLSGIGEVRVEIYRVFPNDSTVPASGRVPTRANSPSDVAFAERDSADATLSFVSSVLVPAFNTQNSVLPGGIHPIPNQTTGGTGPASGTEVRFSVTFATPFDLPADHYFFVPQVQVSSAGSFMWLSSVRPIASPGTPFAPDLQAWTRDAALDPDWLRVGTDIVGGASAPTFNLAFTLQGETVSAVPEPETWALLAGGLALLAARRRRAPSGA